MAMDMRVYMCQREVSSPAQPWSLILAHDEITPGNVLRPDNARKFSCFYFTFHEFGDFAIRHEAVWFHVGVLRSSIASKVVGGLGCAVRLLMRALVVEEHGFTNGVVLPLDDGPTLLFARLRNHLGDEGGLAAGLCIKGAAGIRPCLACANVVKKGSDLIGRGAAALVEISCTDANQFVNCSDADVWRVYDRLVALDAHATRTEMDRQLKAAGVNLNANGIIADVGLRGYVGPVSSLTYDWQHTYLSNGVASQEMFEFLSSCKKHGIHSMYSVLETFCKADWTWPQQLKSSGKSIANVFNKVRERASHDHWKSGASELLTVIPLVRHFAESIVLVRHPQLHLHVKSLLSCFKVIDMLQDAKGGPCNSDALSRAVKHHLDLHKSCYGEKEWKPKMHYALHIPSQILRDNMLFDCFVVERSHQVPKLIATAIQHTASFEKSVIARALLARLRELAVFDERSGLRGRQDDFPEMGNELGRQDVRCASQAAVSGFQIHSGDMLFVGNHVISMKLAIASGDDLGVLGHACDLATRRSSTAAEYSVQAGLSFMWLGNHRIRRAHVWTTLASGHILVLAPDLL